MGHNSEPYQSQVADSDCFGSNIAYAKTVNALKDILELPLHDKLLAMEALWADISRDEDQLEMPEWHKAVLDERAKLVETGEAKFVDWEAAKERLRKLSQ